MKPLTVNNMATLIPPWADLGVPYAYDSAPSHCNTCVYDGSCAYDEACNTCGITSSTWVATTFHSDAEFADNGGDFPGLATCGNGYQRESAAFGMSDYGYRYYKPDLGRWINRDPLLDPGSPPVMLLKQLIHRRLNSYAVLYTIIMMDRDRPTDVRVDALQEFMHIRNVIGKILNNEPFLWMSLAGGNLYSFSNNNSLNGVDWWGLMARRPAGSSIEDYGRAEYQRRAQPEPTDDYREVVENAWESIPVIGALARRVRELYAGASRELGGTTVPSSQQSGDDCQDESYYQVGTDSIDGTPIMIRDLSPGE